MANIIGVYGLSVMGSNLALNIASKGFQVSVGNRSESRVDDCVNRAAKEGLNDNIHGFKDPKSFVASLQKPRRIIFLVMAGKPVDDTIATFSELLEEGDILIDGGNEWYENSVRRAKDLESKKIKYIAMGVSGGEEGARNGPSLMPGGPKDAVEAIMPILEKIAAKTDSGPCTTYIGGPGSGNYVKMVHNGIEYGDMQLISEAYEILRAAGLSNVEMSEVFAEWNRHELDSFLIEITSTILIKKDCDIDGLEPSDKFLIDCILDRSGSKGTGRMTVQEFAERGIAGTTITAALDQRYLSSLKDERVSASGVLNSPPPFDFDSIDRDQLVNDVRQALYASKICSYAQGMNLIKQMSKEKSWGINLGECARIWKGGCIIRAKFLDRIKQAYDRDANLPSLLVDKEFADELNARQISWRRIVSLCTATGYPCPSMSASLAYFDTYRRASIPGNLIQAQRDFFGSHTFERIDKPRGQFYHCRWTSNHA